MKKPTFSIALGFMILAISLSCNKTETVGNYDQTHSDYNTASTEITDTISMAATLQVQDKQFIKSAEVNIEVKDVYNTTISLEKALKEMGGFVTSSMLNSQIISEEIYNNSDEKSTLIRKFQTENMMKVRVPTEKLGDFLTLVNNQKTFLNTRNITAEDVTANIKMAELETQRNIKTGKDMMQLKNNADKVIRSDQNKSEENQQKIATFEMTDNLKYSTVSIFIKEPKLRIAEIAITNTKNIDNKYKFNFFYDAKNALIEGFYLIQKTIVGLLTIWPLVIISILVFYFFRKRKTAFKFEKPNTSK